MLTNGTVKVHVHVHDLLTSIGDEEAAVIRDSLVNNTRIRIDPESVTADGMLLLEAAFSDLEIRLSEDKAVHLLHICILLGIQHLYECLSRQPTAFVTDNNCLAVTTCLFDHERTRGPLVQHCLHRLHRLWPKLVARYAPDLRQLLASCAQMPFTEVLVEAFRVSSDPHLGGFCNARFGYGMLLHLLRRTHSPEQCRQYCEAVNRIDQLPDKPLKLLPYLFAKQIAPDTSVTCRHCHSHLLYKLLQSKNTPTQTGVTEIHSTDFSTTVVWKVQRFWSQTQPIYSFDFRTPKNRVLHMRIDPQGFGRGSGSHLSLFLKESTSFDEDVNFHFVLAVTSTRQDGFVRPMSNCVLSRTKKEYTGRQAFMPLDTIRDAGYVEPDGSLLVMLEVVELPSQEMQPALPEEH